MADQAGSNSEESIEGTVPSVATPQERRAALDKAFDYRGDVTIRTRDGRDVQGYVFDRRSDAPQPYVRIIPTDSDERIRIPYDLIVGLRFSGRDTAAGKSWQAWVEKYKQKKAGDQKAKDGSKAVSE